MVDYFQSFLHMDEEQIAPSTQHNREFLNIVHFMQFLIRRDYKPSELYSAYTDFVRLGTYFQPLEVRETPLDDRLFPSLTQERREKRVHVEMTPNGLNGKEKKRVEMGNQRFENGREMGNKRLEIENELFVIGSEKRENETGNETGNENENDKELESTSNTNPIDREKQKNEIENMNEIGNPTPSNIDSNSNLNLNLDMNSDSNPHISHSSIPSKKGFAFSPHSVLDSLLYQPVEVVSPTHRDTYQINSVISFLCRERDFLSLSPIVLNRFLFST